MKKKEQTVELEKGEFDDAPPCKNNLYVGCVDRAMCEYCGWNRRVAAERITWNFGKKFVEALSE